MEAMVNGADLAKFQLYDTEKFPDGKAAKNYAIDKAHELTFEQAKHLFEYGEGIGIEVFFSVFDVERVKWCEEIGVKRYKVAYSQNSNRDIIDSIPEDKQIIISTSYAMADRPMKQLFCVPNYPANIEDYTFDYLDGISDHTIGLDAAKIALARGAEIIEKHFCLTREGQPDNA
ncbi:MAG: N-acetylneuraminate synthase family protein, partial [Candidatus Bathyarchaeota archaeon]|nr:N-acetylneuraminate synthase family protein [Candidatus Bathyarchaeota archaeon]